MIFLISLTLAEVFAVFAGKPLKKNPLPFYLAAVFIAALSVLVTWSGVSFPTFIENWVLPIFTSGGLSGGLFVIVMFTGAFPNGSKPIKKLMPIRGQLSIIASILTLGHNLAYGKIYFVKLLASPSSLPITTCLAAICSLIMIIIMLPLFITSFLRIRRKMQPKMWKRLQRTAYVFYALLYCHILLLMIPNALVGRSEYIITIYAYTVVFLSYAVCRMIKFLTQKKILRKPISLQFCAVLICSTSVALFIPVIFLGNIHDDSFENAYKTETKETSEISLISLPEKIDDISKSSGILHDGIYTGSGMGMNSEITVEVTVLSGKITDITVLSSRDDEPYYSDALAVIDDILSANSTEVDVISGATYSSGGIIDAVEAALEKAGK